MTVFAAGVVVGILGTFGSMGVLLILAVIVEHAGLEHAIRERHEPSDAA